VTTRRRRDHHRKPPRGTLLAFLALAIQAMLPFFLAVEIARAANPAFADTVVICSALGHHDSNGTTGDHHSIADGCPICTALAAGHGFTAPPTTPLPLPVACEGIALSAPNASAAALLATSSYQSRAPPAIA
jgi:DUF2946 family protein